MKRKLIAAVGVAGMVIGLAACGGSDDKGGNTADKASGAKELTVWLTVDAQNNWPELVKAADDAVVAKHPVSPSSTSTTAGRTRTPSWTPCSPRTRRRTSSRWATPR